MNFPNFKLQHNVHLRIVLLFLYRKLLWLDTTLRINMALFSLISFDLFGLLCNGSKCMNANLIFFMNFPIYTFIP